MNRAKNDLSVRNLFFFYALFLRAFSFFSIIGFRTDVKHAKIAAAHSLKCAAARRDLSQNSVCEPMYSVRGKITGRGIRLCNVITLVRGIRQRRHARCPRNRLGNVITRFRGTRQRRHAARPAEICVNFKIITSQGEFISFPRKRTQFAHTCASAGEAGAIILCRARRDCAREGRALN